MKTILWDLDGTLLDFEYAERETMKQLFHDFSLGECDDDRLKRYSAINQSYWKRLEKGEIDKQEVLLGRYREFFALEGLDVSLAEPFNTAYQKNLCRYIAYLDDSLDLVQSLKGQVNQYIVSNGTILAQTGKLKNSGFDKWMDGIFLSEEIGYEKPSVHFFEHVFSKITVDLSQTIIVGDSLGSDIQGGNNAGIKTVWYNPRHKAKENDIHVDMEISDLHEILSWVNE